MKRRLGVLALIAGIALAAWVLFPIFFGTDEPVEPSPGDGQAVVTTTTAQAESDPSATDTSAVLNEPSQSAEHATRDGVRTEVAALSFEERVSIVSVVTVDDKTWVLSEFSTDTRNKFIDDGTAGERFDPFGSELLLIADDEIIKAFPMNAFPAGFVKSEEGLIFAGRNGDGGYPDSNLVVVNPRTLRADYIVFAPGSGGLSQDYADKWEVGGSIEQNYFDTDELMFAAGAIVGRLDEPASDYWLVRRNSDGEICVSIDVVFYGCQDAGPVLYVATPVPDEGLDHSAIRLLAFGDLPPGADTVTFYDKREEVIDSVSMSSTTQVSLVHAMWVNELVVGQDPFRVVFTNSVTEDTLLDWPDGQ